jgi:hypothetical protein
LPSFTRIALLPVAVAELVEILVELVVLEAAAAGEPGEGMPLLRLHLLAELAGLHVVVADEVDAADLHPGVLADLERDRAETGAAVAVDAVFDQRAVEAVLLVILLDLVGVLLDLALVEGAVGDGFDLLGEAAVLDLPVALEAHVEDAEFRGDLDDQVDDVAGGDLALHLDEFKEAGAVEGADVAVDDGLVEVAAVAQRHVGAHDLLADVGGADEFDRDGADFLGGLLGLFERVGLGEGTRDQSAEKRGKN